MQGQYGDEMKLFMYQACNKGAKNGNYSYQYYLKLFRSTNRCHSILFKFNYHQLVQITQRQDFFQLCTTFHHQCRAQHIPESWIFTEFSGIIVCSVIYLCNIKYGNTKMNTLCFKPLSCLLLVGETDKGHIKYYRASALVASVY